MDPNLQTYKLRMKVLENTLADHRDKFERVGARNATHSAQIRNLERQIYDLKFENNKLHEQVETLHSTDYHPDTHRSGQYADRYNKDYDRIVQHTDRYPRDDRDGQHTDRYREHDRNRETDSKPKDQLQMRQPEMTDRTPVYMLIRVRSDNLVDLKRTFQKHSLLMAHSGAKLLGVVYPDTIRADNAFSKWNLSKAFDVKNGGDELEYGCDNAMVMMTFPTPIDAKHWVEYHPDFKIAQFPEPNGAELLLLPINMPVGRSPFTIVMMEYSNIDDPEYFRVNIMEPMNEVLDECKRTMQFCVPYVTYVKKTGKNNTIRGWWLGNNKTIVAHSFYNDTDAKKFCHDVRVKDLQRKAASVLSGYVTTVRFTVEPRRDMIGDNRHIRL